MKAAAPKFSSDPSDCPCTSEDLQNFLDLEDYDRCRESLRFGFRASCSDRTYWVWSYKDAAHAECCLVVTRMHGDNPHPLAGVIIGCGAFGASVDDPSALVEEMIQKNV